MSTGVVGVVGAGVIGTGVAQNLAQTGHRVILLDVSEEVLERARRDIRNGLRLQALLREGETAQGPSEVLRRVDFTTDYGRLGDAEFVIENVTENWEVKRSVYQELDRVCPEPCIFASNTSAIPITRIGAATRRAAKVLGIHFMNPVPMKPVVEVIPGHHTAAETVEAAKDLLARMGKSCVVVKDSPGFVSNRVLMLTINEAVFLLQEGVAGAEDVDAIFKSCFGHKMGPLETADLIGLDTVLFSIEVLYDSFKDGKYRPCPLLQRMVEAGLHGRKSGRGFYTY